MKRVDYLTNWERPEMAWHGFKAGQRFMWGADNRDSRVVILKYEEMIGFDYHWFLEWDDIPNSRLALSTPDRQNLGDFLHWWHPIE